MGSIQPPITLMAEAEDFLETFEAEERDELREMEFAICVGRFYPELAESLIAGATDGFQIGGVTIASTSVFDVPGAYELPFAARLCADKRSRARVVRSAGSSSERPGARRAST